MASLTYTDIQKGIIQSSLVGKIFLEGPAGSGKTTAALGHLNHLLEEVPGHHILMLVPQRSLGRPYADFLQSNHDYRGSLPSILTLGGLARRMLSLFWPLAAPAAGFHVPQRPPHFLSLETVQYCMAKVVDPRLEKGFFSSVTISPNRIYSQVIDNMNKAAVVRFPLDEIAERLKSDRELESSTLTSLEQAQTCALDFRKYCLEHNLLDYSLQIETFMKYVWPLELCQNYFHLYFRHLIFDNLEEDVPAAHDLVREWLPGLDSALLIMDQAGGYRTFLGADPHSAQSLASLCKEQVITQDVFNQSADLQEFKRALEACILHEPAPTPARDFSTSLLLRDSHFYPQMIADVADEIASLLQTQTVEPGEIVVLAPYLSDVLKFSLQQLLERKGIPSYSSRPSRMYLEEPAVKCMLAFAKLAHPQWEMLPSHFEMRHALMLVLPEVDIVRADLIAQTLYSPSKQNGGLRSFDAISNPKMQERITYALGEKVERMRAWLEESAGRDPEPLDVFLSRLYGELLSQKGFGFFNDFESAARISQLFLSIKSFRQFLTEVFALDAVSAGMEFIRTLEAGLLPSIFLPGEEKPSDAVLIAPAHTFLMENRPVSCQFWLDIGSLGWWERLNQPLTNPYILRRAWQPGEIWTIEKDYAANQESLQRITAGLINRCRQRIYVYSVQVNERGSENRGPLLRAFQTLRKRTFTSREEGHV